MNPAHHSSRLKKGVSVLAIAGLSVLLVLPTLALYRLSSTVDWRILAGVPILMSLVTLFAYRNDKRRAEAGDWRIPEPTLHLAELIGGWPGGYLAQRIFRHKISKGSFQFTFWLIVLLHQFLAFDSLMGWKFTTELLDYAHRHPSH